MSKTTQTAVKILIPLAILAFAIVIAKVLLSNKPEAKRFGGREAQPMLVETKQLTAIDYQPWIESQGVVNAHTQTRLSAQVSGRVTYLDEKLRRGARFAQGDVLLKIEQADYLVEVQVAQADVANAESALQQELAQKEVAEREWNLRPKDEKARALVLREPQVKAARAALKAAQARLERAQLNLERTVIKAPYDGRVLERFVDVGQVINANTQVAEIFSADKLEVRLPVKNRDLEVLDFQQLQQTKSETASLTNSVKFEAQVGRQTYSWSGHIVRIEGAIDNASRQLHVIAGVRDASAAENPNYQLKVGSFVKAFIAGKTLQDVFAIPRESISQKNEIALKIDGKLTKVAVDPIWLDQDFVVVEAGSPSIAQAVQTNAAEIVLTPVSNLANGTRIATKDEVDSKAKRTAAKGAGRGNPGRSQGEG